MQKQNLSADVPQFIRVLKLNGWFPFKGQGFLFNSPCLLPFQQLVQVALALGGYYFLYL